MDGRCISQNELAQRWQVSESTLERWRSQRTGPMFLRLGGQVRYRITDVEAFETQALGMATGQISDKMARQVPSGQINANTATMNVYGTVIRDSGVCNGA